MFYSKVPPIIIVEASFCANSKNFSVNSAHEHIGVQNCTESASRSSTYLEIKMKR